MHKSSVKLLVFFEIIQLTVSHCPETVTTFTRNKISQTVCAGEMIFDENFDTLDEKFWGHEQTLSGCGNEEFEWYVNDRQNSYVEGGILYITPTLTADFVGGEEKLWNSTITIPERKCTQTFNNGCNRTGTLETVLNPVRSARIWTKDRFSFKYGILEIRAKIPAGDWLWPALWLMPQNDTYGNWPDSGEIDLMEARGNRVFMQDGTNIGVTQATQTVHFPDYYTSVKVTQAAGFQKYFHTFQMRWTPDKISFYIDDVLTGEIDAGFPFDQEFYVIINLAIGGKWWFPNNAVNVGYQRPWVNGELQAPSMTSFWLARNEWLPTWKLGDSTRESSFKVDHVRVWALSESKYGADSN